MIDMQPETTLARLLLRSHPAERNVSMIDMQPETTLARLPLTVIRLKGTYR